MAVNQVNEFESVSDQTKGVLVFGRSDTEAAAAAALSGTITRIEGFEGNGVGECVGTESAKAALNGNNGVTGRISMVSSPVRTGTRAFRVSHATGISSGFGLLSARFLANGTPDATNVDHLSFRIYFRRQISASADVTILSVLQADSTNKLDLKLTSGGLLKLGAASGATVIPIDEWVRIEGTYRNGVGREIKLALPGQDTATVQVSDATASGGVGQLLLGGTGVAPSACDWLYDDIIIMASNTSTDVDYAGPGVIRRHELTADGTDDQWNSTTTPNEYQSADGDCNGDTDLMEAVVGSDKSETFVIQDASTVGLIRSPAACQLTNVCRREVNLADIRMRIRSGATISESTGTLNPGSTYSMFGKVFNTDPNTGSRWTKTDAGIAQPGIRYANSAGDARCTLCLWQVADPVLDSNPTDTGDGVITSVARAIRVDEVGHVIPSEFDTFESQRVTLVASTDTTITFSDEVNFVRVINWSISNILLVKDGAITSDTDATATRLGKAPLINVPNTRILPFKTTTIHLRSAGTNEVVIEGYK